MESPEYDYPAAWRALARRMAAWDRQARRLVTAFLDRDRRSAGQFFHLCGFSVGWGPRARPYARVVRKTTGRRFYMAGGLYLCLIASNPFRSD